MAAEPQVPTPGSPGLLARYERSVIDRINDFNDPRQGGLFTEGYEPGKS